MKILKESYDDINESWYYNSVGELKIPVEIQTVFPKFQVGEMGADFNQIGDAVESSEFLEELKDVINQFIANKNLDVQYESDDMITTTLTKFDVDNLSIEIKNTY